jgi:hypothetical protein
MSNKRKREEDRHPEWQVPERGDAKGQGKETVLKALGGAKARTEIGKMQEQLKALQDQLSNVAKTFEEEEPPKAKKRKVDSKEKETSKKKKEHDEDAEGDSGDEDDDEDEDMEPTDEQKSFMQAFRFFRCRKELGGVDRIWMEYGNHIDACDDNFFEDLERAKKDRVFMTLWQMGEL